MSASIRVRMKLHSVAGTYMIRSVDRQHEGRYICVVSNTLGKIELPVNVTVLGTTVHDVCPYCIHTHARYTHTHTHTHTFNGPFSGTTRVSRYRKKVKPVWILLKQRDGEWQWHQLGHMQVCASLQTDNHASNSHTR